MFLSENLFGFRSNFSTELAALSFSDHLTKQMDMKGTPIGIDLDLSRAFDTLDYNYVRCFAILIQYLKQIYTLFLTVSLTILVVG